MWSFEINLKQARIIRLYKTALISICNYTLYCLEKLQLIFIKISATIQTDSSRNLSRTSYLAIESHYWIIFGNWIICNRFNDLLQTINDFLLGFELLSNISGTFGCNLFLFRRLLIYWLHDIWMLITRYNSQKFLLKIIPTTHEKRDSQVFDSLHAE